MRSTPELTAHNALAKLATYPYVVLTWVEPTGYPVSVAVDAEVDPAAGTVRFERPAGLAVPMDQEVSLTGSHIRPQPGYGYDERRHVTVWGNALPADGDRLSVEPTSAWGWDEAEVPFFEYSERSVGKARRYFDALSRERGTPVKPRLSLPFLVMRTTRLPFLSATIVPVVLGILIAASHGFFDALTAVLTIIGACLVQLAINVSNDVFDTVQGADDANVTPTKFSGGSRVIQYGLVSFRGMATLAAGLYAAGALVGLLLLVLRGRRARPRAWLHGSAAQARVPRARRDRRRHRVWPAHAARRLCRPVGRRARMGAVRRLDPGRPAGCADPVRQPASARSRSASGGERSLRATGSPSLPRTPRSWRASSAARCRSRRCLPC